MTALADLFGKRETGLQTGTVSLVLEADRYQVTDASGRRYEVRSASVLRMGQPVQFQGGVVVRATGQARPLKTYNV